MCAESSLCASACAFPEDLSDESTCAAFLGVFLEVDEIVGVDAEGADDAARHIDADICFSVLDFPEI